MASEKQLPLADLVQVIRSAQLAGKVVVFSNGCFDLLHPGHVHLLQSARKLGDLLVVAVNSDDSIRYLKGANRPIFSEECRVTMLAALACVDHVVIFEEDTPIPLLEALRPDVLVKGDQYSLEDVVGHEVVLGYGGQVERVAMESSMSTTALIERLITIHDKQ